MAQTDIHSGVSFTPLFDRCKLPPSIKDDCEAFVKSRYLQPIRPAPFQGYCSYTIFVGDNTVVQFRPSAHRIDIKVAKTACDIFGSLAPETICLGELGNADLCAFSMKKLPGVSLTDLRAVSTARSARRRVVRDFARVQEQAWRHARSEKAASQIKGTVGSSLRWRIESMASSLPHVFGAIARSVLANLADIESLPWVFTHGDFLPSNLMVKHSGELLGLLDWAEAEWLPFGVGMYGLEELLGEDDQHGHFSYYPEATGLRQLFWKELLKNIPELSRKPKTLEIVQQAQNLGILLWHGIAFDDGKLDRVVEVGKDDAEIHRLEMFLLQKRKPMHRHLHPLPSISWV
ncbi:hypothetical protein F5Y16DRAFT_408293 [Xylariaceae sp. FL0255]|nr:hypothetical protein F5Y16DRAFT_408293 [Xylariaceae sp. FL0255]